MLALFDTFNGRIISRHLKINRVVRAYLGLNRTMTGGAYLPITIKQIDSDGGIKNVDNETLEEFQYICDKSRDSPLSEIK